MLTVRLRQLSPDNLQNTIKPCYTMGLLSMGSGHAQLYNPQKGKVIPGIYCRAPFRTEKINPSAKLSTFQIPLKPVESQMQPLDAARDQLPQGRTIHALLLTYKLSLEAEGKHRVTVPMLNRYQNSCMMSEQGLLIKQQKMAAKWMNCCSVCLTM